MRPAKRPLKPSSRPASEADVRQVYDAGTDTVSAPDENRCKRTNGRCWARTNDLRLVETALSQLS
jgi:hypothetical protein